MSLEHKAPLAVIMTFWFPRPKSHFRTGRYAHLLKDSAPRWHVNKPDSDNLEKAVLDALGSFLGATPLFWDDDCQVCVLSSEKRYVCEEQPEPGLWCSIYEVK